MLLLTSYIVVAVALVAAGVVFFRKHRSIANVTFSIGVIATSLALLGDAIAVYDPYKLMYWKRIVFVSEIIMAASWLLFTGSFARKSDWRSINIFTKSLIITSLLLIVLIFIMPIDHFFYSPEFDAEFMLFLGEAGYVLNLVLLLSSAVSLINVEATLKSSSGAMRWNIKYPLLGIGSILAINVFYYSHALLYRSLNMNYLAARVGIVSIAFLLIAFSILRHKFMDIEVVVSRKLVYKSITMIVIGMYLLGLGLIGEGLRYFGPEIGKIIATFLGFVGAIIILTAVLSEQVRRKTMVFINKNFYSQKYDYREQWLKFTQQISLKLSFDDLLGAIAEGMKDAIGSKGATIWMKDAERNQFICVKAICSDIIKLNPNDSLIKFMKQQKWVLNRNDPNCKQIVLNNAGFFECTGAELIIPLFNINDLLGFIVLREGLASDEYNYEDYDLLKTLALQASSAILNANLTKELTEIKEMEAVGRLSSFVLHDLKNAASNLSLIVQNAEEHMRNPEFQKDMIRSIAHSSEKIGKIVDKLKKLPKKMHLHIKYNDLGYCVKSVLNELNLNGKPRLTFHEIESVRVKFDFEEIRKVIINLLMNALDATRSCGEIKVTVGIENHMGCISVADTGCGMSEEFIEHKLFKPFETTKGKGLGIGLYQSKIIVEAHRGKLSVMSHPGGGSTFSIYLPMSGN